MSADIDRFDHLPVLSVRTRIDAEGTEIIERCNDRFAQRLGRARADLVGQPASSVYALGATPPALELSGADEADTGAREEIGDTDSTRESGPFSPRDRSRDGRCWPTGKRPKSISRERHRRVESAFEDLAWGSKADASERGNATDTVCTLVAADGHLVQTIAESVPRSDGTDGQVILHVDMTRRQRRERQAEVLNRVMRHNVRNDLNLLRGHATVLQKHDDDEVVDSAEVLDRIADRWLGLAETVRNIERLFDEVPTQTSRLDEVVASARRTVEREWERGRVETASDLDSPYRVSERLHVALVELCENGIKHNDAPAENDDPVVRVEIEPSDVPGWVLIHVVDNGPGIPQQELTALHADEETPLLHGSGLGFWLVRFVVRRLGGELVAEDRDGDGSVVSMHVPLAEDA